MTSPRSDSYDVVVVGGGLGGLSAGASLAKLGKHVLLVDRLDGPGGCAHAFVRNGYVFDPAIHVTGQVRDGEFIDSLLRLLGVRNEVEFIMLDRFYGTVFPDLRLVTPAGLDNFIHEHARQFPGEAGGLEAFFRLCAEITSQAQAVGFRVSLGNLDEAAREFPTLFRWRTSLIGEALDEHVRDPRARSLCSAIWPYMGVPPEKLNLMHFAGVLNALADAPAYTARSFQALADALAGAIERNGGEVMLGTTVDRITLDEGRVTGVVLEGGEEILAPVVISNVDGRQTFEELLDRDHVPAKLLRRLDRLKPSLSSFIVFTATTLDLTQFDVGHEMFLYKHWDHGETYRDILAGKPGGIWISLPSLVDPSLAPSGESIVIVTSLASYEIGEPWELATERFADQLLDEAEAVLPGYRDSITYFETAPPTAMTDFTRAYRGAIYGWDHTPDQLTTKRLPQEPPIEGLYLAGHWTEPGGGSVRVIYSGAQAALKVLGYPHMGAFLDALANGAGA
jgi:prolycopene isomerase